MLSFNKISLPVASLFLVMAVTGKTADVFSSKGSGTRGPAVLSLEPGARNAGVAGAFAATVDDGEALFTNPAGLQRLANGELRFSGGSLVAEQTQTSLSIAHPSWQRGERQTWGAYVQNFSMESFNVHENGDTVGTAHPQDWVAAVVYARAARFGNWGLALKGVSTETYETKGKTAAVDFGVQGGGSRWRWGASVSNMGPSFQMGEEQVGLPTRLRLGMNRRWASRSGDINAAILGDLPSDDNPAAGVGLELKTKWGNLWHPVLRAGVRTSENPFALGAGVGRGSLSIQYAYTPTEKSGDMGQIDVVLRFGHEPPQETRRRELTGQARALIDSGNFGQAQATLDQIFLISPRYGPARALERELRLRVSETLDPDTLLDLGRRNVSVGNNEKAAEIFRKLLAVDPGHVEGKKELAQVEFRLSEKQAARLRDEVARLKEKRARNEAIERQQLEKVARSFEQSGEWEQAFDVWLKIQKTGRNVGGDVDRCRGALYREAEKALKDNDHDRAQALFVAAERGGAYRDAGARVRELKKMEAERRAAEASEKYRQGQAAYMKGDLKAAEKLFEDASLLDPHNRDVQQALSHVREEIKLSKPASKP